MTRDERLQLIKEVAEEFNANLAREKEQELSLIAWTDSKEYLNEYYGDKIRDTKSMDMEWN